MTNSQGVRSSSELFKELRPLCVEIAREPTSCRIDALRLYMESKKSFDFSKLMDYILYPLQATVARTNVSLNLRIDALNCMCHILSRTGVRSVEKFKELFQCVCFLLSSKEPGKVSSDVTEDFKDALLNCIYALLNSSSCQVLEYSYKDDFMPQLGHSITLLLDIAQHEKSKNLVVKSIECIEKFVFYSKSNDSCREQYDKLLSAKLASFLPGISIALSKVVTAGIQQGTKVIVAALKAWGTHIEIVLRDEFFHGKHAHSEFSDLLLNIIPSNEGHLEHLNVKEKEKCKMEQLVVNKDKGWYTNTASKFEILLQRISCLATHSSWKVRLALLDFSELLLVKCSASLKTCVPILVEIVIGMTSDDYDEVSKKSKSIVSNIQTKLSKYDQRSMVEIIVDKLFSHFTALPRQIRGTDEKSKIRILHIILGYIQVLGDHVRTVFHADTLLKRFTQAFIQVLEFDVSDIRMLELTSGENVRYTQVYETYGGKNCLEDLIGTRQFVYKKKFKHFRDEYVLHIIEKICWSLGSQGNLILFTDHLLEQLRSSLSNSKQIIFIINEIMRGSLKHIKVDFSFKNETSTEKFIDVIACVKLIMGEYLSKKLWCVIVSNHDNEPLKTTIDKGLFYLPNSNVYSTGQFNSISQLNSNIQMMCLMLEGIGILATVLKKKFDSMLLNVLYPVMEKLGSRNATVSNAAYCSLLTISICCEYKSIQELIASNVDYLINTISLNLRHIELNRETPAVLNAMIQYGDERLLPFLEDTLDEVLNLIDFMDESYIVAFLKVLNSFSLALSKWFPMTLKHECEFPKKKSETATQNTDLRGYFVSHLKMKKESQGELSMDEIHENEFDEETQRDEKNNSEEISLQIKLIEKVVEKCSYFITARYIAVRQLALSTIHYGLMVLSGAENQLLPMIHKMWQYIVQCLRDDELIVRNKCLSLLLTMVNVSGHFMKQRVVKDVLPNLLSYLKKQHSLSANVRTTYSHTMSFKFQLAILNVLGKICHHLDILDIECGKVIATILPYLSEKQPELLQKGAFNAIKHIAIKEPDLVWLSLNNLYCPRLPTMPGPRFQNIQFSGLCVTNSAEFASNVEQLLEECHLSQCIYSYNILDKTLLNKSI